MRLARWAVVLGVVLVAVVGLVWMLDTPDNQPAEASRHNSPSNTAPPVDGTAEPAAMIELGEHDAVLKMDDAHNDGWESEVFHELAKKQLNKLGNLLVASDEIDSGTLQDLVSADTTCDSLLPVSLRQVFEDQALLVERPSENSSNRPTSISYRGSEGLAAALSQLIAPLTGAQDQRFHFKVVRVEPGTETVTTHQFFSLSGRQPQGIVEQHASWKIQWTRGQRSVAPKIFSITVHDFEQITSKIDSGPLFADCTEAALQQNDCFREQILRGANHWLARVPDRSPTNLVGMTGLASGDVNGDSLEDIYLCQDSGIPNLLLVQQTDGTFRDKSAIWQVDWLHDSRSALLVDLDNDGDQDLVVAILGGVVLAANEGYQRFTVRDVVSTSEDTTSLTAVDYDLDGRLDLYVCVYRSDAAATESLAAPLAIVGTRHVYHDSQRGGRNMLLRNVTTTDGRWRFEEVTAQVGFDKENRRWSYAASWEDFDNDHDLDLYVANDFGPNHLWRNDAAENGGRTFVNVAEPSGTSDRAFGMSAHWGDVNRDGFMDLYVGNMFSAAGNRITHQQRFKPDIPSAEQQRYRYISRGNTLLQNTGDGTFVDVSQALGVSLGRWAWNSRFLDLNNDSWLDLLVANGFITNEQTSDL